MLSEMRWGNCLRVDLRSQGWVQGQELEFGRGRLPEGGARWVAGAVRWPLRHGWASAAVPQVPPRQWRSSASLHRSSATGGVVGGRVPAVRARCRLPRGAARGEEVSIRRPGYRGGVGSPRCRHCAPDPRMPRIPRRSPSRGPPGCRRRRRPALPPLTRRGGVTHLGEHSQPQNALEDALGGRH